MTVTQQLLLWVKQCVSSLQFPPILSSKYPEDDPDYCVWLPPEGIVFIFPSFKMYVYVYMSAYRYGVYNVCACCSWKTEEGIRFPGTGLMVVVMWL